MNALRRHGFFLAVISLLGLVAAFALSQGTASQQLEKTAPFDNAPLRVLQRYNPDFIFLGNSMLESRIDQAHMERLLPGRSVFLLTGSGDSSAAWFLELKNYVAASGAQPGRIFIFFHDDDFLRPMKNTTGIYRLKMDMISREHEPVLEAVRELNRTPEMMIDDLVAVRRGYSAANRLADRAAYAAAHTLAGAPPGGLPELRKSMNRMFDLDNARTRAAQFNYRDDSLFSYEYFEDAISNTFLPEIVKLAKTRNLPLVFYCVETAPDASGRAHRGAALREHLADIREYVESNGFEYMDITGDPALSAHMYSDDVHVSPAYRKAYTDIFARRAEVLLQ
jgi:hypothetical protein